MHTVLMAILLVVSVLMIIAILLQSSNSSGLSGSIAGGAEQRFGKRKRRGYDSMLARITVVLAVVYIVAGLAIVTLFN